MRLADMRLQRLQARRERGPRLGRQRERRGCRGRVGRSVRAGCRKRRRAVPPTIAAWRSSAICTPIWSKRSEKSGRSVRPVRIASAMRDKHLDAGPIRRRRRRGREDRHSGRPGLLRHSSRGRRRKSEGIRERVNWALDCRPASAARVCTSAVSPAAGASRTSGTTAAGSSILTAAMVKICAACVFLRVVGAGPGDDDRDPLPRQPGNRDVDRRRGGGDRLPRSTRSCPPRKGRWGGSSPAATVGSPSSQRGGPHVPPGRTGRSLALCRRHWVGCRGSS